LHGNRFRVVIRDVLPQAAETLPALIARLREHGLANFYGGQRFGRDQETLHLGFALLHGEKAKVRSLFLRKFALSAAQSALFNHYLAQRMIDGLLRKVLPGDVMAKIPFGGLFVAEDVVREQERFNAREIVSAGPIFGRKTFAACAEAAEREDKTLSVFGLSRSSFAGFGKLLQGTRRHNLVYPTDLSAAIHPDGAVLSFTLPAGSYATVLLREIMKADLPPEESEG